MNPHMTEAAIPRMRHEARAHRDQARHLDALARQARERGALLDELAYRSYARERRLLAKRLDEDVKDFRLSERISRAIQRRHVSQCAASACPNPVTSCDRPEAV